jgi:hypothetical protein
MFFSLTILPYYPQVTCDAYISLVTLEWHAYWNLTSHLSILYDPHLYSEEKSKVEFSMWGECCLPIFLTANSVRCRGEAVRLPCMIGMHDCWICGQHIATLRPTSNWWWLAMIYLPPPDSPFSHLPSITAWWSRLAYQETKRWNQKVASFYLTLFCFLMWQLRKSEAFYSVQSRILSWFSLISRRHCCRSAWYIQHIRHACWSELLCIKYESGRMERATWICMYNIFFQQ